jgi:uncharacterized protein YjbI with pentapeptide repeats
MASSKREVLGFADVRRILDSHKLYLSTDGSNGDKADFSFSVVEGFDFSGLDLGDVYFQESILIRCCFNNSFLADCHFSRTLVPMTSFEKANLIRADFYRSDMSESTFLGADLTGAQFQKCNLRRVVFTQVIFHGTSILESDLSDALLPPFSPDQVTLVNCEGR